MDSFELKHDVINVADVLRVDCKLAVMKANSPVRRPL